ncbi:MAG: hypothetical protein ACMG57_02720 [Candidatus Dojkabacteria bacterium]
MQEQITQPQQPKEVVIEKYFGTKYFLRKPVKLSDGDVTLVEPLSLQEFEKEVSQTIKEMLLPLGFTFPDTYPILWLYCSYANPSLLRKAYFKNNYPHTLQNLLIKYYKQEDGRNVVEVSGIFGHNVAVGKFYFDDNSENLGKELAVESIAQTDEEELLADLSRRQAHWIAYMEQMRPLHFGSIFD